LRRSTRGAAGDIELAPPQYVTLLDLRQFASVADAMRAIDAAVPIDYLPRFQFVDEVAVCVYPEDVAYDDLERLDVPGSPPPVVPARHAWEYIRD